MQVGWKVVTGLLVGAAWMWTVTASVHAEEPAVRHAEEAADAQAGTDPDADARGGGPGRSGAYIGAGLAIGFDQFNTTGTPSDLATGYGADAYLGYRFAKYFAFEGHFMYIPGLDGTEGGTPVSNNAFVFSGDFKGILMTGRIQPYALVGIGVMLIDSSTSTTRNKDTDFAPRFGAGLDVYVTDHIVATTAFSYVISTGAISGHDLMTLTIGAQYRF